MFYLGKGTEFKKDECKEYKTIEGVMKAAAKDAELVVWDENGQIIGSLTDKVPDGALQTNTDGSVQTFDGDGNQVGTVDGETVATVTGNEEESASQDDENERKNASNDEEGANIPSEDKKAENEANKKSEEQKKDNDVIIPQGKMKVTVVCDGSLNLRRSPEWGNDNICGRAIRGQSYHVKEIRMVDGKKMVRTVGDIYLSGESEHVQFEQL